MSESADETDSKSVIRKGVWVQVPPPAVVMECRDIEKMVQPYIEGKLSDSEMESFILHVKNCPSCYDELETYFTIHYALRYLDEDGNRSYNMKKILAEDLHRKESQIRRHRTQKRAFKAMLIVTEAILVFCIILSFLPDANATILQQITDFITVLFKGAA